MGIQTGGRSALVALRSALRSRRVQAACGPAARVRMSCIDCGAIAPLFSRKMLHDSGHCCVRQYLPYLCSG